MKEKANIMGKKITRGDIFYANLDGTVGSEQSGIRPVIVVQNDVGNKYSPTTIVVPLTKKVRLKIKRAGGVGVCGFLSNFAAYY